MLVIDVKPGVLCITTLLWCLPCACERVPVPLCLCLHECLCYRSKHELTFLNVKRSFFSLSSLSASYTVRSAVGPTPKQQQNRDQCNAQIVRYSLHGRTWKKRKIIIMKLIEFNWISYSIYSEKCNTNFTFKLSLKKKNVQRKEKWHWH